MIIHKTDTAALLGRVLRNYMMASGDELENVYSLWKDINVL